MIQKSFRSNVFLAKAAGARRGRLLGAAFSLFEPTRAGVGRQGQQACGKFTGRDVGELPRPAARFNGNHHSPVRGRDLLRQVIAGQLEKQRRVVVRALRMAALIVLSTLKVVKAMQKASRAALG